MKSLYHISVVGHEVCGHSKLIKNLVVFRIGLSDMFHAQFAGSIPTLC